MSRVRGILVTGVGGPPGLGVLRSLREAFPDLPLAAADINPYAPGLHGEDAASIVLPRASDAESYRDAIRSACERHGLNTVIPCSEAEAAALAPVAETFERDHGVIIPVPEPDVLKFGIDKGLLLERCAKAGLAVPKSMTPACADDLDKWRGGFPCVVKPRASRGARGVSYPASPEELAETWSRTVADHGACLVQQLIPGGAETVYTIGTLWNRGELVLSTLHRKLATNPPSGGVAVAGETMVDDRILKAGLDVFRASGPWHGLAAVEVKIPEPGAPAYLLEINPRMWGFGYLMTLAGLNVPARLVAMLNGETPAPSSYRKTRMVRSWRDVEITQDAEAAA